MTEPAGRHRSSSDDDARPLDDDAPRADVAPQGADARQADTEPLDPGYSAQPDPAAPPDDVAETPAELDERHREELADIGRPPPRWKALLLTPSNGVWGGLVLVAAGFSAIFYSWGTVAGTLNANEQLASLVAWGFSGLALVIIGMAAVDVAVRLQDRPERKQQVGQVERSVAELREARDARSRSYY
ncbi:hypothetical protein [Haloechinothrix salitolerans]|uniref:Holin-X, holin superfamily III n=1 Tax=Haloechinothrix salitolerans TaxID=926830 RepID=A0ABW2BVN6_9PSEU